MTKDDYVVAAAAMNGRPQRLVSVDRTDGVSFRDQLNVGSAISRQRFLSRAAAKFEVEPGQIGWLDDAIVAAADEADVQADALVDDAPAAGRKSQATQLVELGAAAELFHDPDGEAYARFDVDGHREVSGVRSRHFRRWMARLFYLTAGKAPSSQAMQDAIGVLEGRAIFEGTERTVYVRVAGQDDKIYIDLCNEPWQVIEVSNFGWRLLDESPVMFRRAKAMLSLPVPTLGGSLDELRALVHMDDDEWTLFVAWLVAAYRPTGPYPILDVQGEHGSGKSTACRMARALVDPNTSMLRSEPREPRDLMISSKNGWVIALDNLSAIQAWQSDCLCRLATGGGFSTRTLYENDEETIFDAQRPVIINGIDEVATRADLLDRCLMINLPRMEQDQRRPEAELWSTFDRARPRILGALLSAVSAALANIATTKLTELPRMADFALWVTAAESALGFTPGQFMAAYAANRDSGNEMALESSPIGRVLVDFIDQCGSWTGTMSELLDELERRLNERATQQKSWPKSAASLGSTIKRLAPNLRQAGIAVELGHVGRGRRKRRSVILTRREPESAVPTDPAVPIPHITDSTGDGGDGPEPIGDGGRSADAVDVSPCDATPGTSGDGGDAVLRTQSCAASDTRPTRLRGLCTGRLTPTAAVEGSDEGMPF